MKSPEVTAPTAPRSLRDELEILEREGELLRVQRPVDRRFELARIAKESGGNPSRPALLFETVKGAALPVVSGVAGSRRRIALALATTPAGVLGKCLEAIRHPVPPTVVETGPAKEVRLTDGAFDLETLLPVPVHHEHDAGPYVTSGIVIARDRETGIQNLSIHRMLLGRDNTLVALVQERHLYHIMKRAEAEGRPLEVAVVLGVPTAIRIAAASAWDKDTPEARVDELSCAGALLGQPVELVRCDTIDVHIPAEAEIVLEGRIWPGARALEGPMAEFSGLYSGSSQQPVIRIHHVTHRREAIFQNILPASPEHHLLIGLPWEPLLFRNIAKSVPGISAVLVSSGSCGMFHCVIQVKKEHDGDANNAIIAAFATNRNIKQAVVVDEDIDIFSSDDVEYAISTRVQADRDITVIRNARGFSWDPIMKAYGYVCKVGIDATKPLAQAALFERARIPDRVR